MSIRSDLLEILEDNYAHDVSLGKLIEETGYSKRQIQQTLVTLKGRHPITVVEPGQVWNLYDPERAASHEPVVHTTDYAFVTDLPDGRKLLKDATGQLWVARAARIQNV